MTELEKIFFDVQEALQTAVKHPDPKIGISEVAHFIAMKLAAKYWFVKR